MNTLINRWCDYLLDTEEKDVFIKRLQETPKFFFFVDMNDDVTPIDFANRYGLSRKDELREIISERSFVTEENRLRHFRYTHAEIDFLHYLCEEYFEFCNSNKDDDNSPLCRSRHQKLLYNDVVKNNSFGELELRDDGLHSTLKNIILKRIDGKIVGFLQTNYDDVEHNTLHFSYIYISPPHRQKGFAKQLIQDTINTYEYQRYTTYVEHPYFQKTFQKLGFKTNDLIPNGNGLVKLVPSNKNIMKIITNGHSGFMQDTLLKKIRKMDEFEWRTHPEVVKMVEDKIAQIISLNEIKNRTEEEERLFDELTSYESGWLGLTVEKVDTSRFWMISEYDNATSVSYLSPNNRYPNFYGFKR